jgi:FxsC-like protein
MSSPPDKNYWFFLSYAKLDANNTRKDDGQDLVARFFNDLGKRLNALTAGATEARPQDVGFFDERGIQAGSTSMTSLTAALNSSRVLVCLYSPAYFSREYCSKEIEFFRFRLAEWRKQYEQSPEPSVIIPVYWGNPRFVRQQLPEAVKGIEIADREFNQAYAERGLNTIMSLERKHGDDYQDFLINFSEYIYEQGLYAAGEPLPPPTGLPSVETIPSCFPAKKTSPAPAGGGGQPEDSSLKGPNVAKFFYVAARRDEFDAQDKRRHFYSDKGGLDWSPFNPPLPRNIAYIATEITGKHDFHYVVENLDGDIKADLEKANQDNVVAVVVVDAWSLRVPRYREMMLRCDSISYDNIIFLILRNSGDEAIVSNIDDLETRLRFAFPTKAASRNRTYFINPVESARHFQRSLADAITKARKRIMDYGELKKQIEGGGSTPSLPAGGTKPAEAAAE